MNKIFKIFVFMLVGLFLVIFAVIAFIAMRVQGLGGSDAPNVTGVAKEIGTFTVPFGFKEHDRRFNPSLSSNSKGNSTAAIFERTDNRDVIMSLVSRRSDTAPRMENARAAFVKKASRFCVRITMLSDDRAFVYGKPLSLHHLSCVLRNRKTNILEGASFAKMHAVGDAGNITITVFASGPKSVWDSEPLHALLASLR